MYTACTILQKFLDEQTSLFCALTAKPKLANHSTKETFQRRLGHAFRNFLFRPSSPSLPFPSFFRQRRGGEEGKGGVSLKRFAVKSIIRRERTTEAAEEWQEEKEEEKEEETVAAL